jgi:hypothetical protein
MLILSKLCPNYPIVTRIFREKPGKTLNIRPNARFAPLYFKIPAKSG